MENQRLKNAPILDAMIGSYEGLNTEITNVISNMYPEDEIQKRR